MLTTGKFCHALKHFSVSFIVKMYIYQKSNNNLRQKVLCEESTEIVLFKYLKV